METPRRTELLAAPDLTLGLGELQDELASGLRRAACLAGWLLLAGSGLGVLLLIGY